MRRLIPSLFSTRLLLPTLFVGLGFSITGMFSFLQAEDAVQLVSAQKTRTIVADFLMVDGGLYIVRGERGEIQIEITPETKLSEKFTFGDRIKAVLLPNDVAQSITRANPNEPIGIAINEVQETAAPPPSASKDGQKPKVAPPTLKPPTVQVPKVRLIIADLLMVDGSFYIVRTEYGEIQIEITPNTELSENFQFGDKIKARITSADKALSVVRAGKDEPAGIQDEDAPSVAATPAPPVPSAPSSNSTIVAEQKSPAVPIETPPSTRIIVADVLMVDGDFYIVRGDRGEIRIEVTPKTALSESFNFGDRIKAEVLPNDKALSIERAHANDPVGITTP
ncbi:MAG: hypothetical protein OEZ57_07660 [Nitrospirota bacterium]|nr:hypothetical protein [Nitrospirota bacterium]MDH5774775.1 hypothetical protein [Nitrospirota bacterium]